jgi:two-component system, LytTR family, sensor kinase
LNKFNPKKSNQKNKTLKKYLTRINPWIGFNDLPFILIGTPLVSVLVTMIFFGISVKQAFFCTTVNIFPAAISTAIFWLGDRYITIQFRKKFPSFHEVKKRILYQSLTILLYTAIMALPLKSTEGLFEHTFSDNPIHPGYLKSFVACLFATIPITAIYEAGFFINRWKMSIAEAEKLKQQNTQSQLEALRNQINPHFLFNSLNTLASLIPEDPKVAVEFVQKLSNVYRSILDLKDKTVVTLEEELEYLDNYMYLLKSRFGDNIQFKMNIHDACMTCYVVPLSVQMLLENAIKHNIVSQKKPLIIHISNQGEHEIVISNNLQRKDQQNDSTGTGLLNIENRYLLTFGRRITVSETDTEFTVKLPLIPISNYESTSH